MPADIIIYAIIAAGLVFWLRSLLGTRHGEERQRPNPFTAHPEAVSEGLEQRSDNPDAPVTEEERIIDLAANPVSNMSVDNKTAENGLINISKVDRHFEVKRFLTGAQDAFAMIVHAFAEGDKETLKNLLARPVYDAFEAAIKEREESGNTVEAQIHSITKSEIIEARLEGKTAMITVRFVAKETRTLRDKDGEIIEGNPERTTDMIDIWTFGRDTKSKAPNWFVHETRADDPDDNDLIPDTH